MASKDKKAVEKRDFYGESIERIGNEIGEKLGNWNRFMVEEKINKLQADMEKFEAKAMAIVCDEKMDREKTQAFYDENKRIEEIYFVTKAKLREKLATLAEEEGKINSGDQAKSSNKENVQQSAMTQQNSAADIDAAENTTSPNKQNVVKAKLANELLIFDIGNWQKFEEQFSTEVEKNDSLNDEEKLGLLFEKCMGTQAATVLNQLCENSYASAFENLRSAYGTAYAQVDYFLQSLMRMQPLDNPNAMEFMSVIKSVDRAIVGMNRHLKENFEQLIPFIIIGKLEGSTRLAWERYRKILANSCTTNATEYTPVSFVPNWQALKSFLKDEAELLLQYRTHPAYATASEKLQHDEKIVERHSSKKKPNPYCDCDGKHPIHKCGMILGMALEDRKNYMASEDICIQCLWTAHPGRDCADPLANRYCLRCAPAQIKHNSLLCPISYERAQQRLAIITPMNSTPAWQASNRCNENWE